MADNNQVPDSNKNSNNSSENAFGIIKDGLQDASKIIGDKRFQKFMDYGSTALVVGSLLMSDENSKKALAVGLALKVGMGIYKAGGIKEYFEQNVNAAKETYADFKSFVQGKEDRSAVTKAYVATQSPNHKIDFTGVSMDHAKSSFVPDENDRYKFNGTANYCLNVPAKDRKEAILKSMSCLNTDFVNRGITMQRKDFDLHSVEKAGKGNYVVNCSVSGCNRSTFNVQNSSFYQLGQNTGLYSSNSSFVSNNLGKAKSAGSLFRPFNPGINVSEDILSTDSFARSMKSFALCANTAKIRRADLNHAELNKKNFEAEFGTGKETGLEKAKFMIKGVREFGSLDKFNKVRSDLDKDCSDLKKAFSDSIESLKISKSGILRSFETLNVSKDKSALDKAKIFNDKVDSFIGNLETDTVTRTRYVPSKNDVDRFVRQNEEPPFEIAGVCNDLKSGAELCAKNNNIRYVNYMSESLKDNICNSSDVVCKNSLSCDDFFVKRMKEVYSLEGRDAGVPKVLVQDMIDIYGKDKASDTLGKLSPDHVLKPEKVDEDVARASNQLKNVKIAEKAYALRNDKGKEVPSIEL